MSNLEVQISPRGYTKRSLVDCMYAVVSSIKGICAKLDDDTGVTSTDYEANVFTAIFNGSITNSRNETVMNAVSGQEDIFYIMSPTGINDAAMINLTFQLFTMMETLTEQLDADSLTDTDYEAEVYTAIYLATVENLHGDTVGASTEYKIGPAAGDWRLLCDYCYYLVYSIHLLTAKLDDDGTVTDTDYEALWDTANILMQVENSKGSIAGNALTKFNP